MLHLSTPIACYDTLLREGLPLKLGHCSEGKSIWLLNIMPLKQDTEADLCRMLAASGETINLTLIKFPGQTYKSTPQAYVEEHYMDFDAEAMHQHIDGLILTGAPLEHMDFEQVRYWPELCQLMEWSKTHAGSTLNICYAAQAALYYHHRVPKHDIPQKMFGVFAHQVQDEHHPLMEGLSPQFPMPHSRHTEVRKEDFPPTVKVLAESPISGIGLAIDELARQVFDTGHLEYALDTLDREYRRDLNKGLPIAPPVGYYHHDAPEAGIDFSWQQAALTFYSNWVRHL
ncbi:MAG: homoserine O-succinyltransferase [Bacteroidales bacterium]|nr:homoserine O-succinyltransferase [Bacteroidales bacterium]